MSRRFAAVAAAGAATVIAVAGCQSGGEGEGSNAGGEAALATQVLQRSADRSAQVETFKATMRVRGNVQSDEGSGPVSLDGSAQYRTSPALSFSQRISNLSFDNQMVPGQMEQVLVDDTLYMKMPQLPGLQGGGNKPWIRASLDDLEKQGGVNLQQMMQQAQQLDIGGMTKMLTASKDAREVGNEKVGGVQTTHYTGTYATEQALSQLDPEQRKALAGQLEGMDNMTFDLWVDDQNLPRKLDMKPQGGSQDLTITTEFRDFDQPVNIEAPPESMTKDIEDAGGGNMMKPGD